MTSPALDLSAIKTRQQATWATGNYSVIGTTLQIVGEQLCETLDVLPGARVLDVAAGNGNVTLAAARRGCRVTSTDYVGRLLDDGRRRADAEGLEVAFVEADAEDLPFPSGSFDVVLSTFGVMFTPDHARAAAEMRRVCAPGGRIGMANWTPDGFIGQLFKVIASHVPPPPGLQGPPRWGSRAYLEELFAGAAVSTTSRHFNFRYRSPDDMIETFRRWYGPVNRAFAAVGPEREAQLASDLRALIARFDRGGTAAMVVPSEYLEAVIDVSPARA